MTDLSHPIPRGSSLGIGLSALRERSGWVIGLGVLFVLGGVIALASEVMATVTSVLIVGTMMLLAGLVELVHAFQVKGWRPALFWLALGLMYAVSGLLAILNPLLAASALTLLLGAALVATGVMRLVLAFQMRAGTPWGWVAVSALVTLLLGGMILAQWPLSSLYVLGLFLGIDLIFAGSGWIGLGMALRRHR